MHPLDTSANNESSLRWPGWRTVAAAHLGVMFSFGSIIVYTFSIFLKPLAADFGWSREAISRAFAFAAMSVAVASPLLGIALDRFGPRAVILPCFAVFGSAIIALGSIHELWHLYALFILIGLAGNGTTQMGYSGAVSAWFRSRRGLALSLVLAGTGIGSILHPQLANSLIASWGWRHAWRTFGVLALLAGIPLTWLWVRRGPQLTRTSPVATGCSFAEALRTREFAILVAVLLLSSVSVNGAITHLAPQLTDRGLSAGHAAFLVGLLGIANLIGRLITGCLLDHIHGARLSAALLLTMAVGLFALTQSNTLAIPAVICIGIGLGGEADVTPFLLSRYFGLKSFSALYGITWTFYALAGAVGPVWFGYMFDTTGSYGGVLIVATLMTLLSAMLMLVMRTHAPLTLKASA